MPMLNPGVIEDWIHTNNFTGEVVRKSEVKREPACGHSLHDGACPDCRAVVDELTAEPYVPGECPDPVPAVRKIALPLEVSEYVGLAL
jgi:hypothetical protein